MAVPTGWVSKPGDQGKPTGIVHLESGGLRARGTDGAVPVQGLTDSVPKKSQCFSSSPKTGQSLCLSSKGVRQEEFSLRKGQLYCSLQADGMKATHITNRLFTFNVFIDVVWFKSIFLLFIFDLSHLLFFSLILFSFGSVNYILCCHSPPPPLLAYVRGCFSCIVLLFNFEVCLQVVVFVAVVVCFILLLLFLPSSEKYTTPWVV